MGINVDTNSTMPQEYGVEKPSDRVSKHIER
jgi:hypothetical protein